MAKPAIRDGIYDSMAGCNTLQSKGRRQVQKQGILYDTSDKL